MSKTTSPIEHTRPATDFETMQQEHIEQLKTELADKDRQLAEARADADHWKSECNTLQRMVHEARAEIERKDKLIEQMREALKLVDSVPLVFPKWFDGDDISVWDVVKAALSAAERGEG